MMLRMLRSMIGVTLGLVLGLAAACHSKDPGSAGSAAPGSGAAGSGGTAAAVAAIDAGTADAAVTPVAEKLPEIKEGYGLVVTDPAGGTLRFTMDDGKTSDLPDGTMVQIAERPEDDVHEETQHVSIGGKHGSVPIENVITSYGDPARSPKGDFLLVMVAVGCGDFCHAALWLLNGPKRHWMLSDNVVLPVIAWRPDNGALAFDNGGVVRVVELPSGKRVQDLTTKSSPIVSPAYAPSGTLYVRNDDGAVYEGAGSTLKKVGKGKKPKHEEDEMDQSPQPVEFDDQGAWTLPDSEKPAHRSKKRKARP
jgi:hypothetical protein